MTFVHQKIQFPRGWVGDNPKRVWQHIIETFYQQQLKRYKHVKHV